MCAHVLTRAQLLDITAIGPESFLHCYALTSGEHSSGFPADVKLGSKLIDPSETT